MAEAASDDWQYGTWNDCATFLVDPDGITIATAAGSGIHRASLLSVTLPKKGRYTVAVTVGGAGDYTMRAIDPEA